MGMVCFEASQIGEVWPLIEKGIEDALETSEGESTPAQVKQGLEAGRTRLVMLQRNKSYFGMVIVLLDFPQFRIARILLGFGRGICVEKSEWSLLEGWARENGCACLEAWVATESRARMFRRFGFEKTYQIIRSKL
jgi:hypothetical protein